ncbi:protoporphyrinogen/coproporphyrinogen oxidase [Nocardia thraciensis]
MFENSSNPYVPDDAAIVVVGAGIAGLSAAFRLQQAGLPVVVLERSSRVRVGGRMASIDQGGFYIDLGAPLLAMRYGQMFGLIANLGVSGQVVAAADTVAIAHGGSIDRGRTGRPLRLVTGGLLESIRWTDRLRLATDFVRRQRALHPADMTSAARWDTESLAQYADRRGLRSSTVECLLDPLATILSLDDPDSTTAVTPMLFLAFVLFNGGLFTSSKGSGFLPQELAARLPVNYHSDVVDVEQRHDGVYVTYGSSGQPDRVRRAPAAVLAVPPPSAAAICPQLPAPLRDTFAATAYSRLIQVTVCLDETTVERAVLVCVARSDEPDLAGFVLQHNLAAQRVPDGCAMITAYFRGDASNRLWGDDNKAIIDRALAGLRRVRISPDADQHILQTRVERISPGVVRRRVGDLRALAQVARFGGRPDRIYLAGGDNLGYSSTIGSLTSGQHIADQIVARHPDGIARP